jgi:hypothetical protein
MHAMEQPRNFFQQVQTMTQSTRPVVPIIKPLLLCRQE